MQIKARWYMLVVVAMQFIVLLFGLLGHGNDIAHSTGFKAGLWKVCMDGADCQDVEESSFKSSKWRELQTSRAFLILSHLAAVAVMAELVLAMLSIVTDQTRVIIHAVTCLVQALFLGLAVFFMTGLPLGEDMGWAQILPWIGFVFACLILPAGCAQIDENGKEFAEVENI